MSGNVDKKPSKYSIFGTIFNSRWQIETTKWSHQNKCRWEERKKYFEQTCWLYLSSTVKKSFIYDLKVNQLSSQF